MEETYVALVDEEWLVLQYCNLMRKRIEQSFADGSQSLRTIEQVIKRWIVGAARRLQATKNLKGVKPGEASSPLSKEKAVDTVSTGVINAGDRQQWEEECYNAMEEEILKEKIFVSRARGASHLDAKPSKEELLEQSKWVVDEMGVARSFTAVKDKSWVWQMYCLLSDERRRITTYKQ